MAEGTYNKDNIRTEYKTYVNVKSNWGTNANGQVRWRSPESEKRITEYLENKKIYDGVHDRNIGGPFVHPYQSKLQNDKIPYMQINMCRKGTRVYADLIAGTPITVTSIDETIEDFFLLHDYSKIWESLILASSFGMAGLQPIRQDYVTPTARNKTKLSWDQGYYSFIVLSPDILYPEYSEVTKELLKLRKMIVFQDIIVEKQKLDILYEETHYKDRYEIRLYSVNGEFIKEELPIDYYNKYIDPGSEQLPQSVVHNLNSFFITLVYNEKIGNTVYSDYTKTIKKLQDSLNRRLTQIDRILTVNADPKLIAPNSALVTNSESGESYFPLGGREVLFYDDSKAITDPFKLLTWSGELTQAVSNRNDLILDISTEFDLAPSLLSYAHLVGGTSAETAAKLEIMLQSTISRAERKRMFLDQSLYVLFDNLIKLQKLPIVDFSIYYPEIIPRSRESKLNELSQRKADKTISTKQYIKELDNLPEDEAIQRVADIFEESANMVNDLVKTEQQNVWGYSE